TLTLIHLISIPVDNTSVNPARSLGTALFADTHTEALQQLWAFIVFPLIGSVVGVAIWLMLDDSRFEQTAFAGLPGSAELREVLDEISTVVDGSAD
ncbi:MAG: aquaporin, partial [Ilumatobacteraceae bacterium]